MLIHVSSVVQMGAGLYVSFKAISVHHIESNTSWLDQTYKQNRHISKPHFFYLMGQQ